MRVARNDLPGQAGARAFLWGEMMKNASTFAAQPIDAAAAILIAVCGLGACGNLPPAPVLKPIEVRDPNTTIPSARLSWYPQGFDTAPRSLNWGVELEYARGTGRSDQQLAGNEYAQSRIAGSPALSARQGLSGVALGVGPRWSITNELALEGRLQVLHLGPSFGETLWYPEVAVRYRPAKALALRMGYSSMSYDPSKLNGGDSAVRIRISGPFLGLHLIF